MMPLPVQTKNKAARKADKAGRFDAKAKRRDERVSAKKAALAAAATSEGGE